MQRRYVFFPRVRRGRERNLFSPLVTIRSFNRGANFASIFRRICVSRGIAKSRRTNVFYKSNSYQGNIFNRAKILLSPSSRFVESRFSSRFAKQKPRNSALLRSRAFLSHTNRCFEDRRYLDRTSNIVTRMREYAVVFRFIDSFR